MDCGSKQCNFKNGRGTIESCQKCQDLDKCYKITVRNVILCNLTIFYALLKYITNEYMKDHILELPRKIIYEFSQTLSGAPGPG